jgi:hypothetical protein
MFFIDLNDSKGHTSAKLQKEMTCEFRKNNLCPTHGLSTYLRIPSVCPMIPWPLQNEKLFLLGSVSLHGLRTAYVSREFKGHRGLSSLSPTEALPHGYSRQSFTQYFGSCQPGKRSADLRRLCPDPYCPCSTSLCPRFLWRGVESNGLCSGLHHDRSLSFTFSMGQIPKAQGSSKITHPFGLTRKHPFHHHYYSWESSRCNHSGSTEFRTGSLLYLRSRLSRFRSPLCDSSSFSIFRDPGQKQFQVQTSLFSTGRQIPWCSMRPDHCPRRVLRPKRLSRKIETDSLFRCHPKQ